MHIAQSSFVLCLYMIVDTKVLLFVDTKVFRFYIVCLLQYCLYLHARVQLYTNRYAGTMQPNKEH